MAVKRTGQFSFVEALMTAPAVNGQLDRLNKLVKWYRFEKLVGHLREPRGPGRPGHRAGGRGVVRGRDDPRTARRRYSCLASEGDRRFRRRRARRTGWRVGIDELGFGAAQAPHNGRNGARKAQDRPNRALGRPLFAQPLPCNASFQVE